MLNWAPAFAMRVFLALLAALAAAVPVTGAGSPWRTTEVCPWSPTLGSVSFVTFLIDRAGTQHLLYFNNDPSNGANQMRYNSRPRGGVWDPFCDEIVAENSSYEPSLAIDSSGVPYAAYAEGSDSTWRVRRRNGGVWLDLGPPLQAGDFDLLGGLAPAAGLVLSSGDQPIIAYSHLASSSVDSYVLLSEWTGSAWKGGGGEPVELYGLFWTTRLASTPDERPMLLYEDRSDSAHPLHYAERLANGLWVSKGLDPGLSSADDIAAHPKCRHTLLARGVTASGPKLSLLTLSGGAWKPDASFPGAAKSYAKSYTGGRVTVGRSGSLHVVAWDGNGNIDYLKKTPRGWAVVPVTRAGEPGGWGADIALTQRGKPLIAYLRLDGMVVVAAKHRR